MSKIITNCVNKTLIEHSCGEVDEVGSYNLLSFHKNSADVLPNKQPDTLAANNEELRSGAMSAADVECRVRDGYPHICIYLGYL